MKQTDFEARARAMAAADGYVTVAKLAAELGLSKTEAKAQLQLMYDRGGLELDLEGDDFVYRLEGTVKGTPSPASRPSSPEPAIDPVVGPPESDEPAEEEAAPDSGPGVTEELREATYALVEHGRSAVTNAALGALTDDPGAKELEDDDKKKLLYGIGLAALFPGVGLFYSAPFLSAGLATAAVLLVLGILQLIPVLGTILSLYVFGAFMLVSGVLGGLYTHKFNSTGRRTRLLKPKEGRRALPF